MESPQRVPRLFPSPSPPTPLQISISFTFSHSPRSIVALSVSLDRPTPFCKVPIEEYGLESFERRRLGGCLHKTLNFLRRSRTAQQPLTAGTVSYKGTQRS
ncbi:hypothetical protein HYPSUDRAFT_44673 [Hypholoma sublateritium FD-334 SS-4]|uniref:Uncharacterized protein n=1 Tax=Hypholoma sublateritium (strain FD-334 SS-4) TaxID=945553 RepID=A0A0D2KWI6_HYPSF|nr:hypothetical protein HYPSUDRAFT_44673 [Hypholoma sublateritium FD-334 SS-4]